MYWLNIYDNTTGKIWKEEYNTWNEMHKRYTKLKYSKKLWVLSHSSLD